MFLNLPASNAADLPVLTWEKGLEHNLVLGGNQNITNWKIDLISHGGRALPFQISRKDARGFVYFSLQVPVNLESGVYTVVSSGNGYQNKVLAGVRLVNQSTFNVIQIPTKLLLILLSLILLISTLSILRMEKYSRIEYIRAKPQAPPKGWVSPFYLFRVAAINEVSNSLFKFKLIREGELLLKISSTLWSTAPWLALFVGAYVGLQGGVSEQVRIVPALIYFSVAIAGMIDPFSGFMAGAGYSFVSIIAGNVTSVRSAMSLVAVTLGWIAPGLISSLYTDALRKDRYSPVLRKFLPELIGSAIGALVFSVSILLTNSFTDRVGPIPTTSYLFPMAYGFLSFLRIKYESFTNKDLHQKGENYQIRVLELPRVLAPRSVLLCSLYFTACIYVWTESVKFAFICGALLAFPMALLLVRFESPAIPFFQRFERHIALETFCLSLIAYAAFVNIQEFPLEVTQKGKMFILSAIFLLFVHGFYSSVYDTSTRSRKIEVIP
jgi:hypothetical protein